MILTNSKMLELQTSMRALRYLCCARSKFVYRPTKQNALISDMCLIMQNMVCIQTQLSWFCFSRSECSLTGFSSKRLAPNLKFCFPLTITTNDVTDTLFPFATGRSSFGGKSQLCCVLKWITTYIINFFPFRLKLN